MFRTIKGGGMDGKRMIIWSYCDESSGEKESGEDGDGFHGGAVAFGSLGYFLGLHRCG